MEKNILSIVEGGFRDLKFSTAEITKIGLLVAISVVLSRFLSFKMVFMGIEGVRIGFGSFPIVFAGIVMGPFAGIVTGVLSDLIGYMVSPLGPYMPHFTFNAALTGFIPALILHNSYIKKRDLSLPYLLIGIGIEEFITVVILLPYFLTSLFGIPAQKIIPAYIARAILDTVIFSFVMREFVKRGIL